MNIEQQKTDIVEEHHKARQRNSCTLLTLLFSLGVTQTPRLSFNSHHLEDNIMSTKY